MTSESQKTSRPRVIALANQKGGVGKTTTAINLGAALALAGRQVEMIDLDPQGNASTGLGVFASDREHTAYDVLSGSVGYAESLVPTSVDNLNLLSSSGDLAGLDVELAEDPHRAQRLRTSLGIDNDEAEARGTDFILIDCPPSLSILTVNAMTAADSVLVPLQCEFFALEGLSQLLATIRRVKQRLNPALEIEGILLTMYDKRNNLSAQVAVDVRENLGQQVYSTIVPRNVRLSEAPSHGLPVLLYDGDCPGSVAYRRLAEEILAAEPRELAEA
ncbi:MAG: AAA family ATPase [Pseudomonadota bacterium]